MNKDDGTFDGVAEQYVGATQNVKCFPTQCLIPDTPCFQKFKPIPSKGKFVSVTGFLTSIERDEDHTVKYFLIDVDQIASLGQQSASPKAKQSPAKIALGTPTHLKFTGFLGSQGTDMKSREPASKKHNTADDCAVEETNDKGEGTSAQGHRTGGHTSTH
ncbi:hypothetical protein B0H14DRAFT_2616318 [Mycena olivaceomarginata]|nr:hypothetical protein B0H14DRAFT_2616318 [Mycena olivaceomarginata]